MGSKEEKHIVIEFQKKILQEAGCSAENRQCPCTELER